MKLRPYQEECLTAIWEEIKKEACALVVASTGSGKTVVFVRFIDYCFKVMGKVKPDEPFRSMILVHKIDLVTQAEDKFNQFASHLNTGLYCGSLKQKNLDADITIGSIDSIKKEVPFINLLIVDEYHRFYNRRAYYDYREKLLERNPKLKTVYFTATPYGKTGYLFGEIDSEIKEPCFQIGMEELIDQGHLVKPIFKEGKSKFNTDLLKETNGDFTDRAVRELIKESHDKLEVQVEDAISRLKERKKAIWCCTSIEHAEDIEEELLRRGEKVVCVHSKKRLERQDELVRAFESGPIKHMISVTKLSEGTDIPPIDAVVCMRPTRSPILYVQMIGRGLRPFEGKTDCLFLDYGGVVEALGHPSKPYIREKSKRRDAKPKALMCPSCMELNFAPIDICKSCNYEFLKDEREIDRLRSLNLVPYDPEREGKIAVLDWNILWSYTAKSGRKMVLISFHTISGVKKQFIPRKDNNKYYEQFKADYAKGAPKYILMDEKNKFVKKRLYA